MAASGIDCNNTFKPYRDGAAPESKTKNATVPVKEMLSTEGWSSKRTYDCLNNKPFQMNGSYATFVLTTD